MAFAAGFLWTSSPDALRSSRSTRPPTPSCTATARPPAAPASPPPTTRCGSATGRAGPSTASPPAERRPAGSRSLELSWPTGRARWRLPAPRRCGRAVSACARCSPTCAPHHRPRRPRLVIAGCAVELVHMATLVHDDQLDRAPLGGASPRCGRHGPAIASATGDHLFARAFAELAQTGDMVAVSMLSDACTPWLGERSCNASRPATPTITVERYLERCRLKTGSCSQPAPGWAARCVGLANANVAAPGVFAECAGSGLPDRRRRARLRRPTRHSPQSRS